METVVADVGANGAVVPREVLQVLGAAPGDRIAFVNKQDGSVAVTVTSVKRPRKKSFAEFIGLFNANAGPSLEDELARVRELRRGDDARD